MEPAQSKVRYKLIMGKFPVVKVDKTISGFIVLLQLPENIKIGLSCPPTVDVREGDLLTVYTEVLANAEPSQSSI